MTFCVEDFDLQSSVFKGMKPGVVRLERTNCVDGAGRMEISRDGEWRTVCKDDNLRNDFEIDETANVLCKSYGFM
jgi:hypothetical protein